MIPRLGDVIGGKYRILRVIGEGGMGVVFEARHELLGTPVALKYLHAELARRPGLAARFLQEARVAASVQSPHVVRVTDVEQPADTSPFLVMELLTGESLQQLLDREQRLPLELVVDLGLQILAGLEAAHALGVVHRDLKPDNVFIAQAPGGPLVKLLDFGIAKLRQSSEYQQGLTRPGALLGTPEYMAPEQAFGAERVDARADLYSFSVIAYELLTGHRPLQDGDVSTLLHRLSTEPVPRLELERPDAPQGLAALLHRGLAPNPEERPRSAAEYRILLAGFAGALSHAGRIAATPAPLTPAPPGAITSPPASVRERSVPQTLPPEPASAPPLAPRAPTSTLTADPALGPATALAPPPLAPASAAPLHPAPPPGLAQLTRPHGARGAAAPRRRRGALVVALLLLALLSGGALVVALALRRPAAEPTPSPELGLVPATPTTAAPPLENEPLPTVTPPRKTAPRVTTGPVRGPGDAGADAATSDAGRADTVGLPGLPPLPSGFPPLPTALPSGFPNLPGWPAPP